MLDDRLIAEGAYLAESIENAILKLAIESMDIESRINILNNVSEPEVIARALSGTRFDDLSKRVKDYLYVQAFYVLRDLKENNKTGESKSAIQSWIVGNGDYTINSLKHQQEFINTTNVIKDSVVLYAESFNLIRRFITALKVIFI